MDIISEILKLGAVGVIAGFFFAYLAVQRHRTEKWWELRAAIYQSLIESPSDLAHYYCRTQAQVIEAHDPNDQEGVKLYQYWEGGFQQVRKAADSGSFLFSETVNAALREFLHVAAGSAAQKRCLNTVAAAARKDLLLRRFWI